MKESKVVLSVANGSENENLNKLLFILLKIVPLHQPRFQWQHLSKNVPVLGELKPDSVVVLGDNSKSKECNERDR